MPRRLLLIGCESADWSVLHPLVDAGALPNLHRLIEGGASGVLASLAPLQREMLWTSLATGCRARRHEVAGPTEARPDGGGIQPVGHNSWHAPAFWDSLTRAGVRSVVIGWPATRAGARWTAEVIDDGFASPRGQSFEDWPLPLDCVPPARRSSLRELRVHPRDLDAAELANFVPGLRTAGPDRLAAVAHMLAETTTVHAAATHIAADPAWQVLAITYRLLDRAQRDPDRCGVDAACRFLDMLVGRLVELCGPETDVLVLSPNGRAATAHGAALSRNDGILVAHGPGIARDRILHGATTLDIAPTILALFGLEFERPADGRVLTDFFAAPRPPLVVAPGPDVPAAVTRDLESSLAALGYRDTLSTLQRQALREAQIASLVNLAESQIALGVYDDAAGLLRRAIEIDPQNAQALLRLAYCQVLLDRWESCLPLAETLLARLPDAPWGHLLKGAIHALAGDSVAAAPHLAKARAQGETIPFAQLQLGLLALRLDDAATAERHFRAALRDQPDFVEALSGLALTCRARRDLAGAETALRQAIALRYHFARAHFQLGLVLADQRRVAEATHALRTALQQDPGLADAQTALQRLVQVQLARGGKHLER